MSQQLTPASSKADDKLYEHFLNGCLELHKRQGLPENKTKAVAVVGAGMAGLTAAWVLQVHGYIVKVFEASNRVGGRVRTLREGFTPGHYVEAGAMRIPEGHRLTAILIKEFDLPTNPFDKDDKHPLVYVDGEWASMEKYLNGGLRFADGHVGSKLYENCLKPLHEIKDDNLKKKLLTSISLGDYLRSYMRGKNLVTGEDVSNPLTAKDIELILLEESRANMEASIMEVLRDAEALKDSMIQIMGGMDRLPKSFCDPKYLRPDSILFNARVRKLERAGPSLSVTYENQTTHLNHTEHNFDKVILAAPFSSLCHVDLSDLFDDPIGRPKLRAIRSLHYENSTKIALEVDKQFWRFYDIEGGRSITDLPIRWIYYPARAQCPGPHGIILASYTWGEDSLRWSALPPETRLRYAFDNIEQLHRQAFNSTRYSGTRLVAGMSYSWAEDSYSLGAFAIFPPHQEEFFEDVWKPYADVHFAGEHTSLRHAWIEGAVESGLRAAHEVDIELRKT